jgi:hypothetical protein
MAWLDELYVRQTKLNKGENDGERLLTSEQQKMGIKDNCGKVTICYFCNCSVVFKH